MISPQQVDMLIGENRMADAKRICDDIDEIITNNAKDHKYDDGYTAIVVQLSYDVAKKIASIVEQNYIKAGWKHVYSKNIKNTGTMFILSVKGIDEKELESIYANKSKECLNWKEIEEDVYA